ncbi:RcnB family protein [Sodalis sp. RH23]|uniref:RcnB family protein n=1 Tax=unclassified Sodalis (in: enterobacteria) TaxID=2636512 RepID=UPI0039B6918D
MMRSRTQVLLFTAGLLAGSLSLVSPVRAEGEQDAVAPQQEQVQPQQEPAQPEQAPAPAQPDSAQPQLTQPQPELTQPQPAAPPSYELNKIIIDDKEHQIGDTVPAKYLTKQYEIVEWQKRHLPAPVENSHWTYASGNYLLITNDTGKILKAESGDIFFSNN